MSDDEILRAEMVAQLCMNDRTHSSLLDLISFKMSFCACGNKYVCKLKISQFKQFSFKLENMEDKSLLKDVCRAGGACALSSLPASQGDFLRRQR